jgi:hypothetical protein
VQSLDSDGAEGVGCIALPVWMLIGCAVCWMLAGCVLITGGGSSADVRFERGDTSLDVATSAEVDADVKTEAEARRPTDRPLRRRSPDKF